MAIEFYAAEAHGGNIISLDDQSVVRDLAALAGTGGTAYVGYLLGVLVDDGAPGGYARFRRVVQRVPHDGAVTVTVTPYRDGAETGQTIERILGASDNPMVTAPFAISGSVFQHKVTLSAFDAPAAIGVAEFTIIPRRSQR